MFKKNVKSLTVPTIAAALTFVSLLGNANADVLAPEVSKDPWARGCQVVQIIQDHGMVRGSGQLDRETGEVKFILGLETDRVDSGPKGMVNVDLYDATGAKLGHISSGEIGIPGKNPGKARIEWFDGRVNISPSVARRVAKIEVGTQYTGDTRNWFFSSWTGAIDKAWNVASYVISAAQIIMSIAAA